MKTSIVILTYNKLEYTKTCIESIRKYTEKGTYEIIVVDNNSSDDTVDWLNSQEDIITVLNKENLGFPKGCNQGILKAAGDNVLLLNNDVIVTPRWLDNLVTCLYSDEQIGAVGPLTNSAIYYQAINVNYKSIDELIEFADQFNISDRNKWEEKLKLVGFCMLIKREVVEKIGLLDEIFTPGNFEDDDYSIRIISAGYRLMVCKDVYIHHFGSVSFKENTKKQEEYSRLLSLNMKKLNDKYKFDVLNYLDIKQELLRLIDDPNEKDIKVLHLGCGGGGTLLKIKNTYPNSKLFGIEEDGNVLINTERFADIKIGDFRSIDNKFENGYFDYIILSVYDEASINIDIFKTYYRYLCELGNFIVFLSNSKCNNLIEDIKNTFTVSKELTSDNNQVIKFGDIKEVRNIKSEEKESESLPEYFEVIMKLLDDQASDEEICYFVEKLNQNDLDNLFKFVEKKTTQRVQVLNYVAVKLFEARKYDFVLPLLQKSLVYDKFNFDTLVNLSIVLETFGQYELALRYAEMIKEKNKEVIEMIDKLKRKIDYDRIFYHCGKNVYIGDGELDGSEAISIGDNVKLKKGFWLNIAVNNFNGEPRIIIDDGCQIGRNLTISVANRAVIGKNVLMAPNVYISDCDHEYKDITVPIMYQGVTSLTNEVVIGDNSWIGINSVIVGNVKIGKGCVIGANSFVNKNIPDYCVAVGNPAKVIKAYDTRKSQWIKIKSDDELQDILRSRES